MDKRFHSDATSSDALVSTGRLPPDPQINALLTEVHARYRGLDDGVVADYISALASVRPELFAVCMAGVDARSTASAMSSISSRLWTADYSAAFVIS